MIEQIQNKNVLFITTKNLDYIRNSQELRLLKKYASQYTVIGSVASNYFKRLLSIYPKMISTNTEPFDVIFIGFAPQLVLPLFNKKFKNKTIIEDFFISMFDTLCNDRKKFKPNSIIGKILHLIDEKTIDLGEYIISDTNIHGDYFAKEFNVTRDKIHTMYLEVDSNIYYPMDLPRPDYLKDKYVVLYFGSILPLQGIDVILQSLDSLKNKNKIFFLFIGPIPKHYHRPESDNIKYISWLSQTELAKHINYADLCLAGHFNASIEKAKRTIPTKAYIFHEMKKPMILGDTPANHELFSDNELISFVEPGNSVALTNSILKHFSDVK